MMVPADDDDDHRRATPGDFLPMHERKMDSATPGEFQPMQDDKLDMEFSDDIWPIFDENLNGSLKETVLRDWRAADCAALSQKASILTSRIYEFEAMDKMPPDRNYGHVKRLIRYFESRCNQEESCQLSAKVSSSSSQVSREHHVLFETPAITKFGTEVQPRNQPKTLEASINDTEFSKVKNQVMVSRILEVDSERNSDTSDEDQQIIEENESLRSQFHCILVELAEKQKLVEDSDKIKDTPNMDFCKKFTEPDFEKGVEVPINPPPDPNQVYRVMMNRSTDIEMFDGDPLVSITDWIRRLKLTMLCQPFVLTKEQKIARSGPGGFCSRRSSPSCRIPHR